MCFLVLDDRSARIDVSVFPEVYEQFGQKVAKDELIVVEGEVESDDFTGGLTLRAERVLNISEARKKFSTGFVLDYTQEQIPGDFNHRLKDILEPHRCHQVGCPVAVLYAQGQACARINLGQDWQVEANDDLLFELRQEFGSNVALAYGP